MELSCKLDWFSFTFPLRSPQGSEDDYTKLGVLAAFHNWTAGVFIGVTDGGLWPAAQERGHYGSRIVDPITGLSISWNGGGEFGFCELSGRVCDAILERIDIHVLAAAAGGRATRIDLAVDMEVEVSPTEFTSQRDSKRFQTSGFYTSPDGETCYVGSRNGERMARVYRYNPPHPRSHLLRAETEYKGAAAKALCEELLSVPLINVTLAAHLPFGWKHPIWDTGNVVVSKIAAREYDKANDGTCKWLIEVCWPALQKGHENGYIDLAELLKNWKPKA